MKSKFALALTGLTFLVPLASSYAATENVSKVHYRMEKRAGVSIGVGGEAAIGMANVGFNYNMSENFRLLVGYGYTPGVFSSDAHAFGVGAKWLIMDSKFTPTLAAAVSNHASATAGIEYVSTDGFQFTAGISAGLINGKFGAAPNVGIGFFF